MSLVSTRLLSKSILNNSIKIGLLNLKNINSIQLLNKNKNSTLLFQQNGLITQRQLFTQPEIKKNLSFSKFKKLENINQIRNMFIDVDATPNINTLKFKPAGVKILNDNQTVEFLSMEKAEKNSPLAQELMEIEGVESVLFGSNFITITKKPEYEWQMLKPDIYVTVTDYIESKEPILLKNNDEIEKNEKQANSSESVNANEANLSNVEKEIIELIETKVKPALQQDGGDVKYIDYKDGIVRLSLHGACRSCSMAEMTLKNGIENMLKHYIPEIKSVERVKDE